MGLSLCQLARRREVNLSWSTMAYCPWRRGDCHVTITRIRSLDCTIDCTVNACLSARERTGSSMSLQHLLQLDRERSQPLYQQIAEQIKSQISGGKLPIGTRLPTVRQLASTLGVTRLTVHSSFSELQSGGWVEATVGRGTFVYAAAQPQDLATIRQIT